MEKQFPMNDWNERNFHIPSYAEQAQDIADKMYENEKSCFAHLFDETKDSQSSF